MKGNKRSNTKPELLVRERLRAAGLTGYRLQWKVPGHPDVAWPGKKVALFVNGHLCQKHPLTNSATFLPGHATSGCPGTCLLYTSRCV